MRITATKGLGPKRKVQYIMCNECSEDCSRDGAVLRAVVNVVRVRFRPGAMCGLSLLPRSKGSVFPLVLRFS